MNTPEYNRTILTPMDAKHMLRCNTSNRPLRAKAVADYRRDMEAGNWAENGDSIRFDWNGVLLNGQHTLTALSQCPADTRITMMVVTGLAPEAQNTMDSGAKRTHADMFQLNGVANSKHVSSILRLVSIWETGSRRLSGVNPTKSEALELYNTMDGIDRAAERYIYIANHFRPAIPSVTGFAYYLCHKIDEQTAVWFFQRLADGEMIKSGDPVYSLRAKLTNDSVNKVRRNNDAIATYMFSAWNATREGRDLARVVYTLGQNIPEPK